MRMKQGRARSMASAPWVSLGISLCAVLWLSPFATAKAQSQDPATIAPTETPAQSFDAGVKAYDGGEYKAAHDIWLPWAHRGDPAAQRNLAHLYRMGLGVPQNFVQAASWYRLAADSGLARAQANLATMYLRGQGVAQDPKEAAFWFTSAATNGHALAQFNLALLYLRGEGVERSEPKAAGWLYLATKAGYEPAIRALAKLVPNISGPAGPPNPPPKILAKNPTKNLAKPQAKKLPPATEPTAPTAPKVPATPAAPTASVTDTAKVDEALIKDPEPVKVALGENTPMVPVATKLPMETPKQPTAQITGQTVGKVEKIATSPPESEAVISLDAILSFFDTSQDSELSRDHDVTLNGHRAEVNQRNLTAGLIAFHAANYAIARDRWLPLAENGHAEAQFQLGKLYLHNGFVEANRPWGYYWLSQAAVQEHPGAAAQKTTLAKSMTDDEREAAQKLIEEVRIEKAE